MAHLFEEPHFHEPIAFVEDNVLDAARRDPRRPGRCCSHGVSCGSACPWLRAHAHVPAQVNASLLDQAHEAHRRRDEHICRGPPTFPCATGCHGCQESAGWGGVAEAERGRARWGWLTKLVGAGAAMRCGGGGCLGQYAEAEAAGPGHPSELAIDLMGQLAGRHDHERADAALGSRFLRV